MTDLERLDTDPQETTRPERSSLLPWLILATLAVAALVGFVVWRREARQPSGRDRPKLRRAMNNTNGQSQDVTALAAIYQAERSETTTLLNINIALLAAELAYLAASVAFIDKLGIFPGGSAALVPAPLWLGLLYNIILIALSGRRGASLLILEKNLHQHTGLLPEQHSLVGARAGEYVVNPGSGSWCYRPALWLVYGIPPVLIVVYTWYILDTYTKAKSYPTFLGGLAAYGVLLVVALVAIAKAVASTPKVS
jgi:hypothetical protein